MLESMKSQRVKHSFGTEHNTTQHKDKVMCLVALDSKGKAIVEI